MRKPINKTVKVINGRHKGQDFIIENLIEDMPGGLNSLKELEARGNWAAHNAIEIDGYDQSDEPFYYGHINTLGYIIASKDLDIVVCMGNVLSKTKLKEGAEWLTKKMKESAAKQDELIVDTALKEAKMITLKQSKFCIFKHREIPSKKIHEAYVHYGGLPKECDVIYVDNFKNRFESRVYLPAQDSPEKYKQFVEKLIEALWLRETGETKELNIQL